MYRLLVFLLESSQHIPAQLLLIHTEHNGGKFCLCGSSAGNMGQGIQSDGHTAMLCVGQRCLDMADKAVAFCDPARNRIHDPGQILRFPFFFPGRPLSAYGANHRTFVDVGIQGDTTAPAGMGRITVAMMAGAIRVTALVIVMVMFMVVTAGAFMIMVVMFMVVTAGAFLIMVVMLVVVTAGAFLIMVVMLVVMAAGAFVIMVVMLMVVATAAFVIMVVMLVVMAAAALMVVVMVMMFHFQSILPFGIA